MLQEKDAFELPEAIGGTDSAMGRPYRQRERLCCGRECFTKLVRTHVQYSGPSPDEQAYTSSRRWCRGVCRLGKLDLQYVPHSKRETQSPCKDLCAAVLTAPKPPVEHEAVSGVFLRIREPGQPTGQFDIHGADDYCWRSSAETGPSSRSSVASGFPCPPVIVSVSVVM